MSEWKEYILEKVCTKITDGSHFSPKLLSNGSRIIATVKDMGEYYFEYSKCKKISEDEYQSLLKNDCKPHKNDILFSKDGTIGKIIVFDGKIDLVILSSIAILRPNIDLVNPQFLGYYLKSDKSQNEINENFKSGSVIPRVILKDFKRYPISLPSLPTQTAIAEILSSLDDKIELNNKINQELEALAQTLFKQWFIDFEFPNENGEPYKSSGGEMVESELGEIPKGWDVKTIGDLGEIVCGKTPSKANKDFFGEEVLFIKIPDMHNRVFITKTEDGLSLLGAESQKNKFLKKGTVILSSIATVGLVSIVSMDSQTNQQINAIVPNEAIYTNFLYLLLKSKTDDFKQLASGGSTTLNMNTSTFKGYKILMPSQNKLDLFDSAVCYLFEKIFFQILEIEELEKLRNTLLPKLISGELEINEISN